MAIEFDHTFSCTAVGPPEADLLVAFGLTEGTSNRHPGQGTTSRRFFFRNAMLELLWVHDEREARSPFTAPTRLWERWRYRSTRYSSFGVCFRPSPRGAPTQPALPFETCGYRPSYLPPELRIEVATETVNSEPMLFFISFGNRPDAVLVGNHQPLVHPKGFGEITALRITLPHHRPMSREVRAVQEAGLVSFDTGGGYLMNVELDHGVKRCSMDFRPALPLRLRW